MCVSYNTFGFIPDGLGGKLLLTFFQTSSNKHSQNVLLILSGIWHIHCLTITKEYTPLKSASLEPSNLACPPTFLLIHCFSCSNTPPLLSSFISLLFSPPYLHLFNYNLIFHMSPLSINHYWKPIHSGEYSTSYMSTLLCSGSIINDIPVSLFPDSGIRKDLKKQWNFRSRLMEIWRFFPILHYRSQDLFSSEEDNRQCDQTSMF